MILAGIERQLGAAVASPAFCTMRAVLKQTKGVILAHADAGCRHRALRVTAAPSGQRDGLLVVLGERGPWIPAHR